jgi:hypothetical protein
MPLGRTRGWSEAWRTFSWAAPNLRHAWIRSTPTGARASWSIGGYVDKIAILQMKCDLVRRMRGSGVLLHSILFVVSWHITFFVDFIFHVFFNSNYGKERSFRQRKKKTSPRPPPPSLRRHRRQRSLGEARHGRCRPTFSHALERGSGPPSMVAVHFGRRWSQRGQVLLVRWH